MSPRSSVPPGRRVTPRPAVPGAPDVATSSASASPPRAPIAGETALALTRRARRINRVLADTYPDAHCELDFTTPLELLVATVLAAQTTDVRVNTVTPALFARYPDALAYAQADRAELEDLVHATGFFRAKAAAVTGLGHALVDRFDGVVPRRLADLVTLPGVGRKTANVVLGNAFGVPGLTVDTHFGRLVRRFGWTEQEDPVKVEAVVADLLPRAEWTMFSHRVIWHGRRCCDARRPACDRCPLTRDCPSAFLGVRPGPVTGRAPATARRRSSADAGNSGPAPGV